jgi:pimeloyl-ACP methyl ester carboxylesterase
MMYPVFVLVHSPLVGSITWSLVEEELRERGIESLVPVLADSEGGTDPYWRQHADSVSRQLDQLGADTPVVLVGHSGAGPRLPVIGQHLNQPVAAYIFVDAGLPPTDGASQLGDMKKHEPEFAEQLRLQLDAGSRFPAWSEVDLRDLIPDASLRQGVLAELQPRALDYFKEPIPVPAGWPNAPCAYLLFSPPYHPATDRAREAGWPWRELPGGHFHMLVEPADVADAIIELVNKCLIASEVAF